MPNLTGRRAPAVSREGKPDHGQSVAVSIPAPPGPFVVVRGNYICRWNRRAASQMGAARYGYKVELLVKPGS
jgi:hypothetical protein